MIYRELHIRPTSDTADVNMSISYSFAALSNAAYGYFLEK
jgi:hypothetical protein